MSNEFQIFFHNIDQTEALQEAVRKRIAKLERLCERIISGRVVLDSPHNHRHKARSIQWDWKFIRRERK